MSGAEASSIKCFRRCDTVSLSFTYPHYSASLAAACVFLSFLSGAAWVTGILTSVVSVGTAAYFTLGAKMIRGEFEQPEPFMMVVVFLLSCIGTYGASLVCKQIEDSGVKVDLLAYLGSHSIYLYMYHVFAAWIICMFTGFSMRYDQENVTGEQFAISLLLAAVSIAVSILIGVCADKIKSKRAAKG